MSLKVKSMTTREGRRFPVHNRGEEVVPAACNEKKTGRKDIKPSKVSFNILFLVVASLMIPTIVLPFWLTAGDFLVERRANQIELTLPSKGVIQEEEALTPKVVLLASWPNSGTSYTIMMTRRATNLSTATNSAHEVTKDGENSIPLYESHPEGPFWTGPSFRTLPSTYILTKTHCAKKGLGINATAFLHGCQRTSGYTTINGTSGHKYESVLDKSLIAKVIHLIRNPYHNAVARFHLSSRIHAQDDPHLEGRYPKNSTGFRQWCYDVEQEQHEEDLSFFSDDIWTDDIWKLMQRVPCHREFYRYIQWHNNFNEITSSDELLFDKNKSGDRIMVLYYEDYDTKHNQTANTILNFLEQKAIKLPFLAFRPLPLYEDHFTVRERAAAKDLMQALATTETWNLIKHYFEQEEIKFAVD